MYYENLFMYITEDYFFFEPITLKPASECMAVDRKLNESFMISKSAISYMTTNQTETKNPNECPFYIGCDQDLSFGKSNYNIFHFTEVGYGFIFYL